MAERKEQFARLAAVSDLARILSLFLYLPKRELAAGIADGSLRQDVQEIICELGWQDFDDSLLGSLAARQAYADEGILSSLRQEYTRLFTHPESPQLYIYESLFRYYAEGEQGERPLLGISPAALDALRQYQQAGFRPSCTANESADHMGCELEFVSFLCFKLARQAWAEAENHAGQKQLPAFVKLHLGRWGKDFFQVLANKAKYPAYQIIGQLGMRLSEEIEL